MSDRRNDLAKIHIAAKQLGMDPSDKSPESSYRAMLWTAARVRSSSELDEHGRRSVIEHLRKCGAKFERPKKAGKRPHNYNQLPDYIVKVEALLADMGLSWVYADTIARNITGGKGAPERGKDPGVEKLAWVKGDSHWRAIIAALSVEQEKRGKQSVILQLLGELGKDVSYVEQLLRDNGRSPKNWHRKPALMGSIIEHLVVMVEQPNGGEQ